MRLSPFIILVLISIVTACQPRETTVEVTRVVNRSEIVEVTRIVPERVVEEATRLVTEEVVLEVTRPPLGTDLRPIQLLFPPVVDSAVVASRGNRLAQFLARETGQTFEVGILDDEAAVIDLLCAAPADTIAFLPATGYLIAHDRCQAQPGSVALYEDQLSWRTGMIVTRTDAGIEELEDLQDKTWAVGDQGNIADTVYFRALFEDEDIEVGEVTEVSGESAAMLAVLAGQADFATASFVPPIMPFEESVWEYGVDSPEPSRFLGIAPSRSPIGYVVVNGDPQDGGYRLRDARSRVFDVEPDIFDQTRILTLSAQLPNETVVFGRDFPLGLWRDIMSVMETFTASTQCAQSICSTDFYGWTGLTPVTDAAFEPLRYIQESLDLSDEEMLELAN